MRRTPFVVTAGLFLAAGAACGGSIGVKNRVGLGVAAGRAPGISGKAWTGSSTAIDFSYALVERPGAPDARRPGFHFDHLWHLGAGDDHDRSWATPYLGLGLRFLFEEEARSFRDVSLALRAPVGVAVLWGAFEPFVEAAPVLWWSAPRWDWDGSVGLRVYW